MEISMILKIAFMILILLYIFSLFHCYKPKCSSSTVEHYEERLGGSAATDVEDMNDPEFHEDPKTGEKYYEDPSREPSDSVVIVVDPNTGKKYVIDSDFERILGITM